MGNVKGARRVAAPAADGSRHRCTARPWHPSPSDGRAGWRREPICTTSPRPSAAAAPSSRWSSPAWRARSSASWPSTPSFPKRTRSACSRCPSIGRRAARATKPCSRPPGPPATPACSSSVRASRRCLASASTAWGATRWPILTNQRAISRSVVGRRYLRRPGHWRGAARAHGLAQRGLASRPREVRLLPQRRLELVDPLHRRHVGAGGGGGSRHYPGRVLAHGALGGDDDQDRAGRPDNIARADPESRGTDRRAARAPGNGQGEAQESRAPPRRLPTPTVLILSRLSRTRPRSGCACARA